MSIYEHASVGRPVVLQEAVTATGNGTVLVIQSKIKNHSFYVTGATGVSAGAVTLEHAPAPDYAGTWQTCAAAVTVAAGTTKVTTLSNTPLVAVRARVSTTVTGTGGSVTVTYIGN